MISQAERLAEAGFALHWLHPKSKRPIGRDWSEKPVLSFPRLRQTYREGNNLGVRLGEWSIVGGYFMHLVDVDIRKAELRDSAFAKLADVFPELNVDTAPAVISGSGGESRHYYLLSDQAFPARKFAHSETYEMVWDEVKGRDVKKWDWELHLLGTGSQAAIPPSIHPDTDLPYRWLREFDFDDIDLGLVDHIPAAVIKRVTGYEEPVEVDPERMKPMGLAIEHVAAYLSELPFDEWCEDRDGWFRTGMAVHHETGGSDAGFKVWANWSSKSKKFDAEDAQRVWKSYKNRAARPFRMASLVAVVKDERMMAEFEDLGDVESEFEDQTDDFDDLLGTGEPKKKESSAQAKLKKETLEIALGRDAPEWVRKINRKHAVARVSGKTVVMDFHPGGRVSYGSVTDLHNFYENDRRPKDGTTVPATKIWMQHQQRRTYPNGIVFLPNQEVEGAYNHWQGFSVEPDSKKSCKLFLKHLRDVFCNGVDEHYTYMLGWLAHMIQKPEDKPGVAVVAKGKKRIGKDTVFEYVGRLFTNHYVTVAERSQMIGKFNQHQEKVLLLHMQEGFWAGNKQDEGVLKYLITSRDVMIEPKGLNAFQIKSVLRLFISSNERWVVPATEDEGRFFVVNVSEKHRNDHKYFEALRNEMDNGGPAALLDFLMTYDISKFQVRAVPDTEALAEQKLEGLKNVESWWFNVLQHGSIDGHAADTGVDGSAWGKGVVRVQKNELRENYSRWMKTRRYDGEEVSEIGFSQRLKVMLPDLAQVQGRNGTARMRCFVLPDLGASRRSFEKYLGSDLAWPDDQQIVEYVDDDDDL